VKKIEFLAGKKWHTYDISNIVHILIVTGVFLMFSDLEPPINQFWSAKHFCDIDSPTGNFLWGETQHFTIFTFLGHPAIPRCTRCLYADI